MQNKLRQWLAAVALTTTASACTPVLSQDAAWAPQDFSQSIIPGSSPEREDSVESEGYFVHCNHPKDPSFHQPKCQQIRKAVCEAVELVRGPKSCDGFEIRIQESSKDNAWGGSKSVTFSRQHLVMDEKRAAEHPAAMTPADMTRAIAYHEVYHALTEDGSRYASVLGEYQKHQKQTLALWNELRVFAVCQSSAINPLECQLVNPNDAAKADQLATQFLSAREVWYNNAKILRTQEHAADVFAGYVSTCLGQAPDDVAYAIEAREEPLAFTNDDAGSTHPNIGSRLERLALHQPSFKAITDGRQPCPFPERFAAMAADNFHTPLDQLPPVK